MNAMSNEPDVYDCSDWMDRLHEPGSTIPGHADREDQPSGRTELLLAYLLLALLLVLALVGRWALVTREVIA